MTRKRAFTEYAVDLYCQRTVHFTPPTSISADDKDIRTAGSAASPSAPGPSKCRAASSSSRVSTREAQSRSLDLVNSGARAIITHWLSQTPRLRGETPAPSSIPFRRSTSLPPLNHLRKLPRFARLTWRNLHDMDRPEFPITPDRSTTAEKSLGGRSDSTSRLSTSSQDAGTKMEWIGLMREEAGLVEFNKRPLFKRAVKDIVDGERSSVMKPQSVRRFHEHLDKMKQRNENTLAARLMPYLVKEDRLVSGREVDGRRSFEDDCLDWNINADFRTGCVPVPKKYAPERDLEKAFGVKNPRPDVAFGLSCTAFTPEEQMLLRRYDPELSKGIISPFLVAQWKGFQGLISVAKQQARRDGAAMVSARRKAIESAFNAPLSVAETAITASSAGAAESVGSTEADVDMNTIAFSCVINTDLAHIQVHWALGTGDDMVWHMAVVKRFHLGEEEDVQRLRAALHNIIDWNLDARLLALRNEVSAYKRIYEAEVQSVAVSATPGKGKRRRFE